MELDKTTIGLSLILAVVVAMLVFSASLPVTADDATQSATVTKNTTAVTIMNQSAGEAVSSWTFTGKAGEIDADPQNSVTETQNISATNESVATLKNVDTDYDMKVYLTFGAWSANDVGMEYYSITAKDTTAGSWSTVGTGGDYAYDSEIDPAVTITENGGWNNLWLKLELLKVGTPTSTFIVESEVV